MIFKLLKIKELKIGKKIVVTLYMIKSYAEPSPTQIGAENAER
jgi:hypothetical protein